ncbi:hypothetical protein AUP68_10469 [Ilyonectria robusta]
MSTLNGDLDARKRMIPGEVDSVASQAIEKVKGQVAYLLNNLLENDGTGSTAQDRKEAPTRTPVSGSWIERVSDGSATSMVTISYSRLRHPQGLE